MDKKDKVTFLLLHLGYGGIETATINTANTLIDKYDIELVTFYNLKNNQENKLDKRIKIKYLCKDEPNRNEIKDALKHYNFIRLFKESIKSIKILTQKKVLIIREILNCDSKYIISTRYDFSRLLSKYGNKRNIKIAQEHHYHNDNKKYIKIISNKYKNIDYLFALTKCLENDYKKFLVNNKHTKVVLVPNMLYDLEKETSTLNNNNLITVSRLDYKKRLDEIIDIFSKLEDKNAKLFIIGDGQEYNNLKNKIEEMRLIGRVILTGYKNKDEIKKFMLKSNVFLMASETEGLPMVLLEAMNYGIPVIAYETASGVNDIVDDGINGYVIKERNQEEYVNKLNLIMNNKDTRINMGKNAKKTARKFSKESICKIWYRILK